MQTLQPSRRLHFHEYSIGALGTPLGYWRAQHPL